MAVTKIEALHREIDRLRAVNANLLAACKRFLAWRDMDHAGVDVPWPEHMREAEAAARAALADVEASQ